MPIRPNANSPSIAGSVTEYASSIVSLPHVMPRCSAIVSPFSNSVSAKSILKLMKSFVSKSLIDHVPLLTAEPLPSLTITPWPLRKVLLVTASLKIALSGDIVLSEIFSVPMKYPG